MKRLLAVLAAVGMVAGAVVVRGLLDGDGAGGGGRGGGASGGDGLVLVCSSTLASACDELAGDPAVEVRIEDDGDTAARLAGADVDGAGAWLTVAPWPEIVADERERAGEGPVLGAPSGTLARSPVALVARRDRVDAAAAACGGPPTWACLGAAAGGPWTDLGGEPTWGSVKPGLPSPDRADGLVVLAQAVASRVGRTDFATNDLDDDPDVAAWFDRLVGAAKDARYSSRPPLRDFLTVAGSYSVVGALEAAAGPTVRRAANGQDLAVIYPEPVVTADVVLVPVAGRDAADALDRVGRERLLDALRGAGWRIQGRPGTGGPDLPDTAGLPAPGVLAALRDRWEDVP